MKRRAGKTGQAYVLWLDGVSSRDLVLAAVADGAAVRTKRVRQGSRSERMLLAIEGFVGRMGAVPMGIGVAQGAGSFSQGRLACAVANALAYAWKVPVAEAESPAQAARAMARSLKRSLVRPRYSGPGVG